jgi:hypothetical protein
MSYSNVLVPSLVDNAYKNDSDIFYNRNAK